MRLTIEIEQEDDGRWIADIRNFPGVMVYGDTVDEAVARAQALATQLIADRLTEKQTNEVRRSDGCSFRS